MKAPSDSADALTLVVVALMKGVLWRDGDERAWQQMLNIQARVRDYVAVMGLRLEIDEGDGYAFLRQRPPPEDGVELPRLVPRRHLSYPVSILLVLLRKKLAEAEGSSSEPRLVMRRDDIIELVRPFLPSTTNEAKLVDKIGTHIGKVEELGFLRRLKQRKDEYEVVRLVKAFVDGSWLEDFDRKLAEYHASATADASSPDGEGESDA